MIAAVFSQSVLSTRFRIIQAWRKGDLFAPCSWRLCWLVAEKPTSQTAKTLSHCSWTKRGRCASATADRICARSKVLPPGLNERDYLSMSSLHRRTSGHGAAIRPDTDGGPLVGN